MGEAKRRGTRDERKNDPKDPPKTDPIVIDSIDIGDDEVTGTMVIGWRTHRATGKHFIYVRSYLDDDAYEDMILSHPFDDLSEVKKELHLLAAALAAPGTTITKDAVRYTLRRRLKDNDRTGEILARSSRYG